ncbi:MAG: dienelactone hydrolase family protein [Rhodospirillaceae bacterium]|jgi:carboxymethylenebutenolidase|nr:dienelactone hydrolase family protein [Rhodospirillaceae bacterium]MBT4588748.1 dienelactone hydrolase family protein [Rhodospirillaceae bacterium]MBT4938873.1 dienelactone hydrolase family protein [Rhodospirillaceae bacterium]MBT5939672.1 dienelactone hydrolase family protein [Rhodospirillaceae bacterium]MBT7267781.1 dienelactone hydrolase family protein [Rhodospirillaceae bacterium]
MYEMISLKVGNLDMPAMICVPEGPGPHPALVIAMHMPAHMGLEGDLFTENTIQRFADNGYLCIVPFIFHRFPLDMDRMEKRKGFDDKEIHADQEAAYQWLIGRDDVDNDRIGILGHCLGGRQSWLAACLNPNYKAIAIMWGGNVREGWGAGNPAPIDLAANIKCPVLGIFGNDDGNPSPEDVDAYEQALKDAGVEYTFHRYDGAGHAFMNPTSGRDPDPYRPEASEDSWAKQLAFLAEAL